MVVGDYVDVLLEDLSTITDIAGAGVLPVSESRLQPGEVRPAAILFLDVVGFTPISRRLTPEQLARLIDKTFRIFELTAKSFGGYLDKVIGDAGLYVFAGHPNYPPPCEAAVSAGLKILERAAQVSSALAELELAIAVRVGVSYGEVAKQVVGGESAQVTVMGDTVNLAQRLESSARPGTLLIDEAVLRKAGEVFVHEEIGSLDLKGFGPTLAFGVAEKKESWQKLRGSRIKLSPFIGREEQCCTALEAVKDWLRTEYAAAKLDAVDRTGDDICRNRLLLISGPQAVGKSRFALEVIRELAADSDIGSPLVHATVNCSQYKGLQALTAEAIRIAGVNAENLVERWEQLCQLAAAQVSESYADRQRRHLPLLAYVLGRTDIDTEGLRQAGASAFETNCRLAIRTSCELAGLLGSPVVMVVEDLQWLESFAPILCDLLLHAQLKRPLVVVATARPEFDCSEANLCRLLGIAADKPAGRPPQEVQENVTAASITGGAARPFCHIQLPLFSAIQGSELISSLLPGVEFPPEAEEELHAKACGLPYYYEEFARLMVDSGMVVPVTAATPSASAQTPLSPGQDNGVRYQFAGSPQELPMPDDIRMLLLGRLDMLNPRAKELSMRASVLGRSFPRRMLVEVEQRLGEESAEGLSSALTDLQQAGILLQQTDDNFLFEHVLTRDAAYDSLLSQNRRMIHCAVADTLTDDLIPGSVEEWDILPQLIDHLERAGRLQEAFDHCCQLLIVLAQSGRFGHWDEWNERARSIDCRLHHSDKPEQPANSTYNRAVGIFHLIQDEIASASECFAEALEQSRAGGDLAGTVKILCNQAMLAHREGTLEQAVSLVREAIGISDAHGLEWLKANLQANLGIYLSASGRAGDALNCYRKAQELHRQTGNKRGEATACINTGTILRDAGEFAAAKQCFVKALDLSQQLGDRLLEGSAQTNLGVILEEEGELQQARELHMQALRTNREIHRVRGEMLNLFNLGEVSYDMALYEDALKYYDLALQLGKRMGDYTQMVFQHCALVRTHCALGQLNAALDNLNQLRKCDSISQFGLTNGIADCSQAFFLFGRGDADESKTHLNSALSCLQQSQFAAGSQLHYEIRRLERLYATAEAAN